MFSDIPNSAQFPHRTKEETEAAHDLLELSRALPPLPCPASYNIAQSPDGAPPTPPTPEEHHYTTLIYITTPPGTKPCIKMRQLNIALGRT